jgi:hypothetical protein
MAAAALAALLPACGGGGDDGVTNARPNPPPEITGIFPSFTETRAAETTLTVTGIGFVRASVVRFNGADRQTEYVDATLLRARLPAGDLATPGTFTITVFNPAPGGGVSSGAQLQLYNPPPQATSLQPGFVATGDAGATVAVIGTGFVPQSQVVVGTAARPTTYVSETEVRVAIPPADVAASGTLQLRVQNPMPGGGTSTPLALEVRAPVPAITALVDAQTLAAQPEFRLLVDGTGFAANSVVRFDGSPRPTQRLSSLRLEATLTGDDLRVSGTFPITVATPGPGGGTSNAVQLTLVNPVPQILMLPSQAASAGRQGFTLTLHGTGFVPGAVVRWNGADRPTTYLAPTRVSASIGAADVASPGAAQVTAHNPAPGGGASAAATLQVRPVPAATLTSTRQMALPARDLVWSAATGRLYASVPGTEPTYGNSVVAIDPATGAVTGSAFVGSEPGAMAVSDDGQVLYVGLAGTSSVRRVALATLTPGQEFPIGAGAETIHVMPGRPGTIAVSQMHTFFGVCLYDDGVRRGDCMPRDRGSSITFGQGGLELYAYNKDNTEFGFRTYRVLTGGLQETRSSENLISGFAARIHYASGRVYSDKGAVVDPGRHVRVGAMTVDAFALAAVPDPAVGRVFVLDMGGTVTVYDMNHFTTLGSFHVGALGNEHPANMRYRLVRWGSDGLAFRDGEKIFIVRTPIAAP